MPGNRGTSDKASHPADDTEGGNANEESAADGVAARGGEESAAKSADEAGSP